MTYPLLGAPHVHGMNRGGLGCPSQCPWLLSPSGRPSVFFLSLIHGDPAPHSAQPTPTLPTLDPSTFSGCWLLHGASTCLAPNMCVLPTAGGPRLPVQDPGGPTTPEARGLKFSCEGG